MDPTSDPQTTNLSSLGDSSYKDAQLDSSTRSFRHSRGETLEYLCTHLNNSRVEEGVDEVDGIVLVVSLV